MRNYYKPGEWNAICDRCGFKYKASMLKEEWQGLMTCPTCWETKHPSLLNLSAGGGVTLKQGPIALSPAPSPAPAPGSGTSLPTIAVQDEFVDVLQVGDHIVHNNVWNAVGLTHAPYTGLGGTTYEQQIGVKYPDPGTNDPIGMRCVWKFPTGTTEVKSYPAIITGNFPGWLQTGTPNIAGTWPLRLQDGSYSTAIPSGKTPHTIFPLPVPITGNLTSQFKFHHNTTPTGRGHLAWDIWIQDSGPQVTGFTVPPITHEIMIPINYWGSPGYGSYPNRNPTWYNSDTIIDGMLFHVYYAPGFNGAWQFIVFEPDAATFSPDTLINLNIKNFLNFVKTKGWLDVPNPVSGNLGTHVVSMELGIECVDGTGDLTWWDFKVSQS